MMFVALRDSSCLYLNSNWGVRGGHLDPVGEELVAQLQVLHSGAWPGFHAALTASLSQRCLHQPW